MRLYGGITRFLVRDEGASAVEFALVLPLLVLLTIGSIGTGIMLFAVAGLHFAAEDAARCVSVKTTVCSSQGTMQTYAAGKYKGPTLGSMNFTLTAATAANCGNTVVGVGDFSLATGLATIKVPLSATACYPASS